MRALLALFLILFSGAVADADLILVPPDLAPGAQYRLAFVTSGSLLPTSANIADYNAFVSNQAGLNAELSSITSWTVIGSTATVAARDNTSTNPSVDTGVPIYRLDGFRIAANNTDLWDGSLEHPLNINQHGQLQNSYPWTGIGSGGSSRIGETLGGPWVRYGNCASTGRGDWIFVGIQYIPIDTEQRPLYAISGVLTAVPEPSSALLVGIGACGWLFLRRRRPTSQ